MAGEEVKMDILIGITASCLIGISVIAILNAVTFPRLDADIKPASFPKVSVLIPARNEAEKIFETIRLWREVRYPELEIFILDDQSEDDTADVARAASTGDTRIHILNGAPLPPGWKGKNWACHQLSTFARGEILLFTDADVRWNSQALTAVISEMIRGRADLLTVWPTQITKSFTERLIVPLIGFVIIAYLPILAVHHLPWELFSAAMGQCMVFRRQAYIEVGGHWIVRELIVDDIALGRQVKKHRLRLRAADAAGLINTRMYCSWKEVREGFAKNLIAGYDGSIFIMILAAGFHWLLFLFPWYLLLVNPYKAFILIALGLLTRALSAAVTRQRLFDAIFMPFSVLLMTLIAFQSLKWFISRANTWKDRIYER